MSALLCSPKMGAQKRDAFTPCFLWRLLHTVVTGLWTLSEAATYISWPFLSAGVSWMILVMKMQGSPSTCGLSDPPAMLRPRPPLVPCGSECSEQYSSKIVKQESELRSYWTYCDCITFQWYNCIIIGDKLNTPTLFILEQEFQHIICPWTRILIFAVAYRRQRAYPYATCDRIWEKGSIHANLEFRL